MADTQYGKLFSASQLPTEGRTALGLAAANGDREGVHRLLAGGADPSEMDAYQDTPLHLAAMFGHMDIVKILVKEQAVPVDPVNSEAWTPLCCAVSRGNLEVVKYLLRTGANGNWVSPLGWQLMHVAAWYNQEAMINWLSEHGALTAPETIHAARPFDLTRPGQTRRAVYSAMIEERRASMQPIIEAGHRQ